MSIKVRCIVEIVGGPKEHVEKAMGVVVGKLKEDKKIKIISDKVFDAKPLEGKHPLFSSFCELDFEVDTMKDLFGFCFDFMPSSVEIYDPTELRVKMEDVNNMFNELLSKLHQYDMALKNIYAQNVLLKRKYEGGENKEPEKK